MPSTSLDYRFHRQTQHKAGSSTNQEWRTTILHTAMVCFCCLLCQTWPRRCSSHIELGEQHISAVEKSTNIPRLQAISSGSVHVSASGKQAYSSRESDGAARRVWVPIRCFLGKFTSYRNAAVTPYPLLECGVCRCFTSTAPSQRWTKRLWTQAVSS